MPVELRKRKAPAPPPAPAPAPKKKAASKAKPPAGKPKKAAAKVADKVEEAVARAAPAKAEEDVAKAEKKEDGKKVAVGDVIDLESFGGEVETNDGQKTSLKKLVDESKSGVVLFTYPKASTPGCEFPPFPSAHLFGHPTPSPMASSMLPRVFAEMNVQSLTAGTARRHQPGLPLPRLLRAPYGRRARHLRPERRLAQGQHHLQGEAAPAVPAAVRPAGDPHRRHWPAQAAQGHPARRLRRRQGRQGPRRRGRRPRGHGRPRQGAGRGAQEEGLSCSLCAHGMPTIVRVAGSLSRSGVL